MQKLLKQCFRLCFVLFSVNCFANTLWTRTEDWAPKEKKKWQPFITLTSNYKESPIQQISIYVHPNWGRFANKFATNKTHVEDDDQCFCIIENYLGIAVNARDSKIEKEIIELIKPFENIDYERAIYSQEVTIPNIWYWNRKSINKTKTNKTISSHYNWRTKAYDIEPYEIEEAHVSILNASQPLRVSTSVNADTHFFIDYILKKIQTQYFENSQETKDTFEKAYEIVNELVPVGRSNSNNMYKYPTLPLELYEKECKALKEPCFNMSLAPNNITPTNNVTTNTPTAVPTNSTQGGTSSLLFISAVSLTSFVVLGAIGLFYYLKSHTPEANGYQLLMDNS